MNILYLYAHPQPASFNATLKDKGIEILQRAGHTIEVSDLYASHFNATASWDDFIEDSTQTQYFLAQQAAYEHSTLTKDIRDELEKIMWADHIFLQFPLWWFSMPAILKGWLDRTLIKGFAYDADKRFETGLLKGKTASLITSTQSPESTYQTDGLHGAPISAFLMPIHHTLKFVGITPLNPFVIYNAYQLSNEREIKIFSELEQHLLSLS